MKGLLFLASAAVLFMCHPCQAGFFDDLAGQVLPSAQQKVSLDNGTIVKGLKEALATGTEHAVAQVARPDGYFGNQRIKILLPDKLQQAAELLGSVGYQQQVDDLVLSMNRSAEKAAPKAARFFGDAIRAMTVEDAKAILDGGDTAATKFFERKTRTQLFNAFRPNVVKSMEQVGTARAYKELIGRFEAIPLSSFISIPSLDLDDLITNKALDGLFLMVGEEEKNIRTNPVAQTTALLKKVFGGK